MPCSFRRVPRILLISTLHRHSMQRNGLCYSSISASPWSSQWCSCLGSDSYFSVQHPNHYARGNTTSGKIINCWQALLTFSVGGFKVGTHAVVEGEDGGCSSNLSSHVTNSAHTYIKKQIQSNTSSSQQRKLRPCYYSGYNLQLEPTL